jgi:CubicO group peptidase (beta-lactamase class C family)
VSWHRNFGVRNAKTTEPVTDDVIFEAASFTKPFFAYYVTALGTGQPNLLNRIGKGDCFAE